MRQTRGPARSREGYHWFRAWRRPTAAQRRVLDELLAGGTYAQIAERLGISEDGVKWHLSEVRDETGLADRRELAEWWEQERNRPAVNLLFPFAALWRFASRNAAATAVVAGVVGASLVAGWLIYDGLRGDGDTTSTSAAPAQTPERTAVAAIVPTPTPTPAPTGALLFDVTTGETTILPGEFTARRWLDTEAMTFLPLAQEVTIVDGEGNVRTIGGYRNFSALPDTDNGRIVAWDRDGTRLDALDAETGEVLVSGDFQPDLPQGARRWAVSPAAGKVAITDEPYEVVTLYDLDGSNPQQIFTVAEGETVWTTAWSRSGEWLLVTARKEDDGGVEERSLVYRADGTLYREYPLRANWVGAGALRLYSITAANTVAVDSVIDLAHGAEIPVPAGDLLCVSPDGRYAVTGQPESNAFRSPTDHLLHDLATGEVVAQAVLQRFLVNCDWTPDSSRVVLSTGGK
jgi:DNA-binding CsgD family transcriptional regulator/outer membrane protein assembly factor BamB